MDITKIPKGWRAIKASVDAANQAAEATRLASIPAPIKASEAYGQHEGKYLKSIPYDRMKVDLTTGARGGVGFSGLQHGVPSYADARAASAVTDKKMSTRIINRNKDVPEGSQVIWTPSVGGLEQHKSNTTMFNQFADKFNKERKNLSDEQLQVLSDRASNALDNKGRLIFPEGIDLSAKNYRGLIKNYDQRGVMADIFAGRGVGGEKGRTVAVEKMLGENLDPYVADVPTGSLGNRLFTLDNNVIVRPDLHDSYPYVMTGEDVGVNYIPVERERVMEDFANRIFKEKGRPVTDMDYRMGDPTQLLHNELLSRMQSEGYKGGGTAKKHGHSFEEDLAAAFAEVIAEHNPKPMHGEITVKTSAPVKMGAGGVITKAMREANLAKFLAPSAEKRRMYHVSKEPNITEFKSRHQMTEDSHDRDAVFLSPKPEFTNSFARGEGTTTYPVYAQIEKPFDFDNPEHLNKVKETYLDMYHNPDSDLYDHYMLPSERSMAVHTFNKRVDGLPSDESNWDSIENQDFQDVLKDLGFDSFYTREQGTKNLGVYDGSRIKSAIGNRGTYDINESDMSKAHGGLVHMGAGGKIVKGLIGAGRRLTSTEKAASDAIGKAAESAGVNPPVMADKMYPPLTNLQDSYTSLGDKIRARVIEAQKQMDTFDYKYDKGQRVFTEDSAKKNRAPYEILQRHRMGNDIVQEDPNNPFSKKVIDPETGKAQRTPYEPAYWVRSKGMENPEDWYEFLIPQTAIKGDVEMAKGGGLRMAMGGAVTSDYNTVPDDNDGGAIIQNPSNFAKGGVARKRNVDELHPLAEVGFQRDIKNSPWYAEFVRRYQEQPDIREGGDYNYRKAWAYGAEPQRDPYDQNSLHWPSALPNGDMLKAEDHPTAWKEHFMREYDGLNPDSIGATKEEFEARQEKPIHMAPGGVVKWASQLAKTINSHKMESMYGEQWMKWLNANAPKSAKKEALASGTLDWLPQQGKVSKGAIIEHMKANAPQIKVKKFENNPKPGMQARYDDLHDRAWTSRLTPAEHEEMQELGQKLEDTPKTKFDEHVLPGGKNYREMTLSTSNPTGDDYIVPAAHTYRDNDADLNRILHMRMNDSQYDGCNSLNIEELHSEWAQQGRGRGFTKDGEIDALRAEKSRIEGLLNALPEETSDAERMRRFGGLIDINDRLIRIEGKGLPSGPYVTETEDWTRLGLHNAIKEAAEQGHSAVTWTGGEAQANRWSNEGLKEYYDTVMPSVSNDILKKMGVAERVGEFDVGTGVPHQGFNITPEMLDYIKQNGMPRFQDGGQAHYNKAEQVVESTQDLIDKFVEMYEKASGKEPKPPKEVFRDPWHMKDGGAPPRRDVSELIPFSPHLPSAVSAGLDWVKGKVLDEAKTYSNPRAIPDVAANVAADWAGMPVDIAKILADVADYGGEKVAHAITGRSSKKLSDLVKEDEHEKPTFGSSEYIKDYLKEKGVTTGTERPISEFAAFPVAPALLRGATRTGRKYLNQPPHLTQKEYDDILSGQSPRKLRNIDELIPIHMGVGGAITKIIKPSELSKLKEYMLKKQGTHGAQRVERASDEVPNLESMYSPEALEWAFGKYNPQTALGVIRPSDFEKYAAPIPSSSRNTSGRATSAADMSKYNTDTDEYVKYLQSVKGFSEVPMLQFDKGEVGLPIMPSIRGHEGRHRNRALANSGEQSSLVVMAPHTNLRSELPNKGFADTHEQFLKALNKEMEMTDNMVTPQTYTIPRDNDKSIFEQERRIIRPNIRLPEMFSEGGVASKRNVNELHPLY